RRSVNRTFGPLHAPTTSSRFDANPECRFQDGSASEHGLKSMTTIEGYIHSREAGFPTHPAPERRSSGSDERPQAAVSVLLGWEITGERCVLAPFLTPAGWEWSEHQVQPVSITNWQLPNSGQKRRPND